MTRPEAGSQDCCLAHGKLLAHSWTERWVGRLALSAAALAIQVPAATGLESLHTRSSTWCAPAQCPGSGSLVRVPSGQAPSLHHLRGRAAVNQPDRRSSLSWARRFHLRASGGSAIAPLASVTALVRRASGELRACPPSHVRTSLVYVIRPLDEAAATSAEGGQAIFRFPCCR